MDVINRLAPLVLLASVLFAVGCGAATKKKGQLCQSDSQCNPGSLCLDSICTALQACSTSDPCGVGVCAGGYCWDRGCANDAACAYGTCQNGYCVRQDYVSQIGSDATDASDVAPSNDSGDVAPSNDSGDGTSPSDADANGTEVESPNDGDDDGQAGSDADTSGTDQLGDGADANDLDLPDVTEMLVPCDADNGKPTGAIDVPAQVTISYDPSSGTWSAPAKCEWVCDAANGYCAVGDSCSTSKPVACTPDPTKPLHSVDVDEPALVPCNFDPRTPAPLCSWSCEPGYSISPDGTECFPSGSDLPRSCQERKTLGYTQDGVYKVWPVVGGDENQVYCDFTSGYSYRAFGFGQSSGAGSDLQQGGDLWNSRRLEKRRGSRCFGRSGSIGRRCSAGITSSRRAGRRRTRASSPGSASAPTRSPASATRHATRHTGRSDRDGDLHHQRAGSQRRAGAQHPALLRSHRAALAVVALVGQLPALRRGGAGAARGDPYLPRGRAGLEEIRALLRRLPRDLRWCYY